MDDQLIFPGKYSAVQRAFSKQAEHYDQDDRSNPILTDWRNQVYQHVDQYLRPGSNILELNAGTGIDAVRLVNEGHSVLATDYAPGMIGKINEKIVEFKLQQKLRAQQCSFDSLNFLEGNKFDYVFSNFGGLNCCEDLAHVTKYLPSLLNENAYVTWVVMPPVSPWELFRMFKGKKSACRRFKNGRMAHLEGEFFKTYYHSLSTVRKNFGKDFQFLEAEGIGAISPPPASTSFIEKHPTIYTYLKNIDKSVNKHRPFNRWADHIIVTFQFKRI